MFGWTVPLMQTLKHWPHLKWVSILSLTVYVNAQNPFWTRAALVQRWIVNSPAFSLPLNISQVHFHCHLHVWVGHKDICERILRSAVHLLERSMELAGLHRHYYGVSHGLLHISCWPDAPHISCSCNQQGTITAPPGLGGCFVVGTINQPPPLFSTFWWCQRGRGRWLVLTGGLKPSEC